MPTPAVRAENVVKHFGDVKALNGVSIEFEAGMIYGLLGPNGAGKTTLIRVLTTLLRPDSGEAHVAGVDVLSDPTGARRRLGLAGQSAAVDGFLTGEENLHMIGRLYGLSKRDARQRADEVLERMTLTEAANRQVKTYSGGMRRRLDLAASMVGRPQVLFLDEPTTGIDPGSRIDIWGLITDLVDGGTTILMTTQYLEEADQLANRIGVIDEGVLIAEGTADELKDQMGGSIVEIAVEAKDLDDTLGALSSAFGDDLSYEEGRNLISIPAPDGAADLMAVARSLDSIDVTPTNLEIRKPTLDDVFLKITGNDRPTSTSNGGQS
ncbi:MAG: ABC-2 type transport system ATP-binding protein [Verrucomicrobiales bacterium]|jgi:ABC-2 type transport system ATP-binding protein